MTASLKSPIRKAKIDARHKLHADDWQKLSAKVVERLLLCIPYSPVPVAIYYPVHGEVDVLPLIAHFPACLPVTRDTSKELFFRSIHPGQHLEKNAHGIMQPSPQAKECQPDIIIVPLVAFDRQGFRIGYGGGYYDTTLAVLHNTRKVTTIGAAFSFQETDAVPHEPFDAKLDMIVTEKEVIKP